MPTLDPDAQREFALQVAARLREAGFVAYWAGGCVRDALLGQTPKDYDIATSARPEEVRDLFGRRRTLAIGAAFGVISVFGPRQAGQVEVTTFREEADYADGRHPDEVTYSNAELDAQRRDFTINGLFYDPACDQVIDYVGGQNDLKNSLVRAIGEPLERFTEDKLRLLRAVRFAATFEFALEEHTKDAVRRMADQLPVVSVERIAMEMRRMLVHRTRVQAMTLLRECGLLASVFNSLAKPWDDPEHWRKMLDVLAALDAPSFPLALAALADNLSEVERLIRAWRLSNQEIRQTVFLRSRLSVVLQAADLPWPQVQRVLIAPEAEELLALAEAVASSGDRHVNFCREKLKLPLADLNPPPLVTGDDLIRAGAQPGKALGRVLQQLRDAQLEGKVTTQEAALQMAAELLE